MTHLPPAPRKYLLSSIAGTPDLIDDLLYGIDVYHPVWDRVIEPDRFALRGVIAHVADWDPIWLGRLKRIVAEEVPSLPDIDEGQVAIDHDYAHSDPRWLLARYRHDREKLVSFVQQLPLEAWGRTCVKDGVTWTLEAWIVLICAHDSYHTQQIAEWVRRDREIGQDAR